MNIDIRLALWLLPLTWAIHDTEEVLTMSAWKAIRADDLEVLAENSRIADRLISSMVTTTREFVFAVAIVGMFVISATGIAYLDPRGIGGTFFAACLGGYLLHAGSHFGLSVIFRGYTPGVITAVFVVFPTAVYLYWRLFSMGFLTVPMAIVTAGSGLLLFIPIVAGSHRFSHLLMNWRN